MIRDHTISADIGRQADGAIDFDFHCARAAALRREAMRNKRAVIVAGALAMVGALAAMVMIVSAPITIAAAGGH